MDERIKNHKVMAFMEAVQNLAKEEGIVCFVVAATRDEHDKGMHGTVLMSTEPIKGNLAAHYTWGNMVVDQTTEVLSQLNHVVKLLEQKEAVTGQTAAPAAEATMH